MRLLIATLAVSLLACTGAGAPSDSGASSTDDQDVRGLYAVSWSDLYTIRLDIGGAVQEQTAGADEIVTFDAPDGSPLALDLGAWCADPAVNCPTEAWADVIAIDQESPTVRQDLHTLYAWDADARAETVTGVVDHRTDEFLFGLDAGSGASGDCGAIALSLAGGTFVYRDAEGGSDTAAGDFSGGVSAGAGPVGIAEGKVALGWLGVCAWSGLAVAATVSIETDFTALRTADLPDAAAR
jgi:hypothetical protein